MKRTKNIRRLVAPVLVLGLVAAACGDDDEDADDPPAEETTADTEATEETTADTEATEETTADTEASGDTTATTEGGGGAVETPEEYDPGITDESIKIGHSIALSGPASAYGVIAQAIEGCVNMINDNGGITMADGLARQIEFIVYDDGYDPARGVENVRRLVEEDEVFALWATLGTPVNSAFWDYVNDEEVPHLFLATGASKWGAGYLESHPWTIGWQPAYTTESYIYGKWLADEHPGSTVAVLFQNDDYGKDYLNGFKAAIEGTDIEVIAELSYETADPTVDQQVTELANSEADVFFNIATPKFAAQAITKVAELGWQPIHLLNSVSGSRASVLEPAGLDNSTGIISAQYLKDPNDPQWEGDEAMAAYNEWAAEYIPDVNPLDTFAFFGWSQCDTMQKLLASSPPTREGLREAVGMMDFDLPQGLPGVRVVTGPDDGYPIETMQLAQFNGESYEFIGESQSYEGATPIVE